MQVVPAACTLALARRKRGPEGGLQPAARIGVAGVLAAEACRSPCTAPGAL